MSLTEQHSAVSPGTDLSSLWRSAVDFMMYLPWILCFLYPEQKEPHRYIRFLIGVETWWWPLQAETCSFIIRIHLSKLWVAVLFDYTSSLSLVSHTTGMTHLEGVIKHIHGSPEYEASAQFMHVRQLLTAPCISTAQQCIIYYSVGFPSGKELALLEMCNQLWSEICDLLGLCAS